jgi:hypothetical protein
MALQTHPNRVFGIIAAIFFLSSIVGAVVLLGSDPAIPTPGAKNHIAPSTDTNPPTVSHPGPQGVVAGQTGASFVWNVTGSTNGATYTIYKNGTVFESGVWTSGGSVNCNMSNLSPGIYNFTIFAFNSNGNDNHSVIVTASPSPSPVITSPGNGSFTVGGIISWTATDDGTNTTTYTVYRNGSIVATGAWTSGVAISINLNGLSPGKYNFTLVVDDGLGGISQDEIIATVQVAPGTASIDGVVWGIVIAFACVGALVVFKAVKIVPLSSKKSVRA